MRYQKRPGGHEGQVEEDDLGEVLEGPWEPEEENEGQKAEGHPGQAGVKALRHFRRLKNVAKAEKTKELEKGKGLSSKAHQLPGLASRQRFYQGFKELDRTEEILNKH